VSKLIDFGSKKSSVREWIDPCAAEFGRRRRILCVSRKSAEKEIRPGQAGAANSSVRVTAPAAAEYEFVRRV